MTAASVQVNVRLAPDELDVVDQLRQSADGSMSRAELLRSLVRQRRRDLVDAQIASAYDATGASSDDLAEASATMAGETLADL